jgi:hypothetical protein
MKKDENDLRMVTMQEEFCQKLVNAEKENQRKTEELLVVLQTKKGKEQAEIEQSHKNQIDALNLSHSMSTMKIKNDAEIVKRKELEQLQSAHNVDIANIQKQYKDKMEEIQNQANAEIKMALMILEKECNGKLATAAKKYEICKADFDNISNAHKQLLYDHEKVISSLEEKTVALQNKEDELKMSVKENEDRAEQVLFELKTQFKGEKESLQIEHLDELQAMLQEFERARHFLKQEISSRDKL